ncbi:MAG: hypothetical protein QXH21_07325 [Ignisphaera sp.]
MFQSQLTEEKWRDKEEEEKEVKRETEEKTQGKIRKEIEEILKLDEYTKEALKRMKNALMKHDYDELDEWTDLHFEFPTSFKILRYRNVVAFTYSEADEDMIIVFPDSENAKRFFEGIYNISEALYNRLDYDNVRDFILDVLSTECPEEEEEGVNEEGDYVCIREHIDNSNIITIIL